MKLRTPILSEHIKGSKLRPDAPFPQESRARDEKRTDCVRVVMDWQKSLRMRLVKNEGDK